MIEVAPHADGSIVRVRAQPGARKNGVTGEHDGALKVAVAAPPDRGKANEAIAAVLAEILGTKPAQVALRSGASSRSKTFLIAGLTPADVIDRLAATLTPT